MSARRGAQFIANMGMHDRYLLENLSLKTTKMLSTRNSLHLDNVFFSVLVLRHQSVPSQNRVPRDLKPNICISDYSQFL